MNRPKKNNEPSPLNKQDWTGIFNTITDMITIHDKDFNIIHANDAAKKNLYLPLLGEKEAKCFKYYHGTPCPPTGCPSCECVKTGIPSSFELFEPHLNRHIEIRAIPRFDNDNNLIGVIHIVRDISKRIRDEEEIRKTSEELRKLTAHLQSVREEERKHIAREIHDELAQLLTALNMDIFWLHGKLPKEQKPIYEKTASMLKLIDRILQTVSKISSELRPGLLDDLGLQEAMEWQADEFQKRTGIKCKMAFVANNSIDPERATTVFRIFQETLTNVVRHAKATRVSISLEEKDHNLILNVKDNGRGITEAEIINPDAFGLIGIRERVYHWKGKAKISGKPDKGTTVTVSIPLNNDEGEQTI
ncbi:MAG: histidine kinase [Thermodesulfovibrionia bacterium]|nr:histidine kinase [Thermodesulfovibrionia bacterium]